MGRKKINEKKIKINGVRYTPLNIDEKYILVGSKGMLLHDDIHLDWKNIKHLMDIYYKTEND